MMKNLGGGAAMERSHLRRVLATTIMVLAAVGAAAQEASFFSATTSHYRVLSYVGSTYSRDIARKLEAGLELYNEYLRFDLSEVPLPLRVRIFGSKGDYDRYLQRLISQTRSDFVFIAYRDPGRSELVGFQRDANDFDGSLLHYGFVQFLNSRIPGAPLWLEEGMATYLEASQFDPATGSFVLRPNLAWLDSLKAILRDQELASRFTLQDLLLLDRTAAESNIEVFYPAALGLVYFLLESPDRRFNRILWDSLSALDPQASVRQNSLRAEEKAFGWIALPELEQAMRSYILSVPTFNDLVREGAEMYGSGSLEDSRALFLRASELRRDSYIPPYYLGLIAYQSKEYDEAARHYLEAQRLGADAALVNYALGVNAFADQDYAQAVDYLNRARQIDPGAFAEKVDSLLKRIEVLR
jgi:tetratricopeptide (TPR) repeat protein